MPPGAGGEHRLAGLLNALVAAGPLEVRKTLQIRSESVYPSVVEIVFLIGGKKRPALAARYLNVPGRRMTHVLMQPKAGAGRPDKEPEQAGANFRRHL